MKKLISLLIVVLFSLSIIACNNTTPDTNNGGNNTSNNEFDTNKITFASAYAKAQNLGFEGTLEEFVELISGKDGADGKDGINGTNGKDGANGKDGVGIVNIIVDNEGNLLVILSNGETINCGKLPGTNGKDGADGKDGKDGADGKTPYIENGYWYIDGVNTGVKAEGSNGKDGVDGTDGKDGADGTDGKDGEDGKTPYIGANGNWWIGETDTGIKAEGNDGKDGADGKDGIDGITPTIEISDDGYWVINGVKTEYKAVADGSGGDTHPHSFGEWVRYTYDANTPCDAWLYYRICSACKDIEWKNGGYENHSFTTTTIAPTCVAGGYDESTCTVCGLVETTNYTDIAGHSYKEEYSFSDSFHWLDCKYCDATANYAEHNIDDSGYCTVCDQPLSPTEGIIYGLSADGTYAEVVGYSGTATKIVIADTYEGVPVTGIYEEAFKGNKSITSVVIPDSVTSIGDYAFYYCSKLTSITIPDSVTSIGICAFSYCKSLASVTIPDSVTSIGNDAFVYCTSLTSVTIGNGVTSIGEWAFCGCSNLTSVTIPDSVTSIGERAFYGCFGLTSVTIPDSVTLISSSAFDGCSKLANVYYTGSEEEWKAISIGVYNSPLTNATKHYNYVPEEE